MAPDKKRRNKRKNRTVEVSSASSSSSSESESESVASAVAPEPGVKKQKQTEAPKTKKTARTEPRAAVDAIPNETISLPDRIVTKDSNKAFEDFYRRQAAQEFAEDLFKLQSAGDFSAKSVPLLIAALQQGTSCFSAEEKGRVVGVVER